MSNNTYKWIIGCLTGAIVILCSFLVVKENQIISVSFSECLSVAATLSSLILSIIAMLYTYVSGRDTMRISDEIQRTLQEVNGQVRQVSEHTQRNSEVLAKIKEGMGDIERGLATSSAALETIQKGPLTEQTRESAIKDIKTANSSMVMFLERMRGTD